MSPPRIALFVVDTGPLITLAAAETLDYLLYPNVDLIIPDAVFYEATRDVGKLGAQEILDWVRTNRSRIEIAVTHAFTNFLAVREVNPRAREPNLGERAAVEVIDDPTRLGEGERAVLLCEETAITRRVVVRERSRIVEISTMDFLTILESERRIQSAEAVFERALAAGRAPSRASRYAEHDPDIRDAARAVLEGGRPADSS
jgi:hypothetical protein